MTQLQHPSDDELDYGFLLLTHMVCADRQIHSEESKALQELANQANIKQSTIEEMEKILAQEEHHLQSAASELWDFAYH